MRREFIEFEKLNPKYIINKESICYKIKRKIKIKNIINKLNKVGIGSEKWHEMQQKLSLLSSCTLDSELRSVFYENSVEKCGGKPYILPNVIICYPYNLTLGYNVFINRGTYITARDKIKIGDNVMIGPNVLINSGMHNYKDKNTLIRNQGHTLKPIVIEDDVWIGTNVVIMPGVTIGKGAVIGAGAIVTKSIPSYAVAMGVPAKVVSYR